MVEINSSAVGDEIKKLKKTEQNYDGNGKGPHG